LAAVDRALQILPDDPRLKGDRVNLLNRAGRYPEMEDVLVKSLTGRTSARLGSFDVITKLSWRGDLAGAAAAVQRLPAWFLSEDRGNSLSGLVYLWAREPKKALEIVNRFPRDYIRSSYFYGPRAVLTAWAHEGAGEVESAKADWQIVLRIADRELSGTPDDAAALHWKAWALAQLGRTDEAERLLRLLGERTTDTRILGFTGIDIFFGHLAALAATVGRPDLAIEQIALSNKNALTYFGAYRHIPKATLRLNPAFDSLRSDPRFQALIDAAAGPEEKKENATASAAALDPKSIAVLAFANMSADKDNEYFSDGLSEEILDKLARNPALRVMARTSSFSYKGKNVPIPQIGRELNVGTIIEGSVRRAGNQLRITAQLINAADGTHIWSETYDKELTTAGIFAIQDEIAQKIAARLAPAETTAAPAIAAAPTQNLAAYEAYLRGRSFQTRSTAFRADAIREYQRAVALDPQFALAWAQLARVVANTSSAFLPKADLALATRAVDEARRLAGDFFETHMAAAELGRVQLRYEAAERELAQAERLRPRTGDVAALRGAMEVYQGRWDAGIRHLRQATELEPQNGNYQGVLGNQLRAVGRYAEAEQSLDRAFGMTGVDTQLVVKAAVYFQWKGDAALVVKTLDAVPPGIRTDRYWDARFRLLRDLGDFVGSLAAAERIKVEVSPTGRPKALLIARARELLGDAEGARRAYMEGLPVAQRSHVEIPQGFTAGLALVQIYAGLGRKDEALATAREVREQANGISYYMAQIDAGRAQIDARFGMFDDAIELLKTQIPSGWLKRNDLLLGADWAELRKDPRFRVLAEKAPP
jgi:TolB-like protein/Flp pilus assembly protein TadD